MCVHAHTHVNTIDKWNILLSIWDLAHEFRNLSRLLWSRWTMNSTFHLPDFWCYREVQLCWFVIGWWCVLLYRLEILLCTDADFLFSSKSSLQCTAFFTSPRTWPSPTRLGIFSWLCIRMGSWLSANFTAELGMEWSVAVPQSWQKNFALGYSFLGGLLVTGLKVF